MREQKWNLGRFIGRSGALLLLFALLFLPSARAEEGENLPKIIIGSDEYQPYSYYNVDGSPQGVDVEMAREAFRRMGYDPVFRHVAWEDKASSITQGATKELVSRMAKRMAEGGDFLQEWSHAVNEVYRKMGWNEQEEELARPAARTPP